VEAWPTLAGKAGTELAKARPLIVEIEAALGRERRFTAYASPKSGSGGLYLHPRYERRRSGSNYYAEKQLTQT
jgi:hypothetical protein